MKRWWLGGCTLLDRVQHRFACLKRALPLLLKPPCRRALLPPGAAQRLGEEPTAAVCRDHQRQLQAAQAQLRRLREREAALVKEVQAAARRDRLAELCRRQASGSCWLSHGVLMVHHVVSRRVGEAWELRECRMAPPSLLLNDGSG